MSGEVKQAPDAEAAGRPRMRRRARPLPKGRQVDPCAREEVRATLAGAPSGRSHLIENLHRIHDRFGHLSAAHLAALADAMRLSLAEVYEVATFYARFDVVREGEDPPPSVTVRVCDGLPCELGGGRALLSGVRERVAGKARVVRAPCMGRCDRAPVAEVGRFHVEEATPAAVARAVDQGRTRPEVPAYKAFAAYVEDGGYRLLGDCLSGRRDPGNVIAALEESGLRGLGGAGFSAGRKWRIVRAQPKPRTLVVNADEGEPGTFKDRHFLTHDPHRFLEGALVAAWAVEAEEVYLYLRDEYPDVREILLREIPEVEAAGLASGRPLHLRRGAGAYVCGEESAMLESLEGKRGLPRHRPPYAAEAGLFGRPTLIHNVETLYWVRDIVERGADWFASQGRNGGKGLRAFSVSGRVKEPGVKIAPAGITARELVEEHCGGMGEGHAFAAYLPGGASGGILPATLADLPLDFGALEAHGCFIGSAGVVVLSDRDDVRGVALNLLRFFADESCGQCTPCRVGTEKAVALMEAGNWDEALLEDLSRVMADASICGLGQAAPNPIRSVYRFFRDEAS